MQLPFIIINFVFFLLFLVENMYSVIQEGYMLMSVIKLNIKY